VQLKRPSRENSERRRSRTAQNRKRTRKKHRLEPYFNFGGRNFLIIMSIEWKNKIKSIDFRHGLDRLYFVATLVWFVGWFIAFLIETFDYKVNIYTDNLTEAVWAIIFILFLPFIVYIFSILLLKVFFWIISGFSGANTTQVKVKIFAGDGSFFGIINKYRISLLAIIIVLVLSSIVIAFSFTSYSSYEERRNARQGGSSMENALKKFGLPPLPELPKLPALPKLPSYIPFDER